MYVWVQSEGGKRGFALFGPPFLEFFLSHFLEILSISTDS